jgi:hypothetical protein
LSRKACQAMAVALQSGWSGHSEVFIPTVLALERLKLEDIGGNGPFVAPRNRHRFYSSSDSPDGRLASGSMRFRPAHVTWGQHPNWLYHPVKERRMATS